MVTALVESGTLRDLCQHERYAHLRSAVEVAVEGAAGARAASWILLHALVVDVLLDVFLALEYLHTRAEPVIHRDVKPANILVDFNAAGRFQKAMLADLGEAKQVVFGTRVAQSLGTVGVGTLLYMAPEMKEADEMKGPKVDIFSCGVTAAEIATGRSPSPGPEMVREGRRRVAVPEEERRGEDIRAVANDGLRTEVVERCITDDPDGRATAAQMVAACRQLQRTTAYREANLDAAVRSEPAEPEPEPLAAGVVETVSALSRAIGRRDADILGLAPDELTELLNAHAALLVPVFGRRGIVAAHTEFRDAMCHDITHQATASHLPYEMRSRLVVTAATPIEGHLARLANTRVDPDAGMQIMFHGAPDDSVASIAAGGFRMPPSGTGGALGTAIYTSRSAVTAFWHCKPTFSRSRSRFRADHNDQRMAHGRVVAALVHVGRSLELQQYDPGIEATIHAEGYDSATIKAADFWPSTYIGDETAVYSSDSIVPLCVLSVEVHFDRVEGTLARLPTDHSLQHDPGTPAKIAALRAAFCNPGLQDVHFEGDEDWKVAVLFDLLKSRPAPMHMVSLCFSCGEVNAVLLLPIAEALRSNCGLQKLRFVLASEAHDDDDHYHDTFTVQYMEQISAELCRALETNTNLTHLIVGFDLRSNEARLPGGVCGADGPCSATPWIELLSKNHSLQELNFSRGALESKWFESDDWAQLCRRDPRVRLGPTPKDEDEGGHQGCGTNRGTVGSIYLQNNFLSNWPADDESAEVIHELVHGGP
jgi:hypothetical protein